MNHLEYVTVKPKPTIHQTRELSTPASSLLITGIDLFFNMLVAFESISSLVTVLEPIKVEGDKIHVKESLMTDNKPYAIGYKGKNYVFIKNGKHTKVFELRD